jgi:hypothetical protein
MTSIAALNIFFILKLSHYAVYGFELAAHQPWSRVTRLSKISPFGRLFSFGSFLKINEVALIFTDEIFSHLNLYGQNMWVVLHIGRF